nr:MAG TPA: hypothetical protein [Caudoviricetes sp.]
MIYKHTTESRWHKNDDYIQNQQRSRYQGIR